MKDSRSLSNMSTKKLLSVRPKTAVGVRGKNGNCKTFCVTGKHNYETQKRAKTVIKKKKKKSAERKLT